jgi:hypothetical protein
MPGNKILSNSSASIIVVEKKKKGEAHVKRF